MLVIGVRFIEFPVFTKILMMVKLVCKILTLVSVYNISDDSCGLPFHTHALFP